MPHICRRCNTRVDALEGQAPRCPSCGGTTFSFISARKLAERERQGAGETELPTVQKEEEVIPELVQEPAPEEKNPDDQDPGNPESIESIRIIEPGRYDLNLLKLAESDDRVIRVGKGAHYRLDLHSMVRQKKKE